MIKVPKVKMLKPFTRWSYSAWSVFKECRYKFGKQYYEGVRGPGSPAMDRGNAIHALSEGFLKGEIHGLPKPLAKLDEEYTALLKYKKRLVVEEFWGVDFRWKKAPENKAMVVMKMDCAIVPAPKDPILTIIDLKTGKEYPGHEDQGSLYAAISHALHPGIELVDVEFWYADGGFTRSWQYTPAQLEAARLVWDKRGKQIMGCRTFTPEPSEDACRWCHLRSDKGGPCDGWKDVY